MTLAQYLFIHEDERGRTLYAFPCGGSCVGLMIDDHRSSVTLDAKALARLLKSLAPVVGAEGGENARTESLPVGHKTEPGPGGVDDGPARASMEGDR